jgi:hypothetical protein
MIIGYDYDPLYMIIGYDSLSRDLMRALTLLLQRAYRAGGSVEYIRVWCVLDMSVYRA